MNTALIFDVPAYDDNFGTPSDGSRVVTFGDARIEAYNGVFGTYTEVPGTKSATVAFKNDATFSADASTKDGRGNWMGKGFTKPYAPDVQRRSNVYLANPDGTEGIDIGDYESALIRSDGSIAPAQFDAYEISGLLPGTYDVRVDGLVFKGALTVTDGILKGIAPLDVQMWKSGGTGSAINFTGRVQDPSNWQSGYAAIVRLQSAASPDGPWMDVPGCIVVSDALGNFTFAGVTPPAAKTTYYRAFVGGSTFYADSPSAVMAAVGVSVTPAVSFLSTPASVQHGGRFTLTGKVSPAGSSVRVTRYYYSGGKWRNKGGYNASVSGSTWRCSVKTTAKGSWKFVATSGGMTATRVVKAK
jgi:hypothetical protein